MSTPHPPLPWDLQQAHDVLEDASRAQHDHQQKIREAVKAAAQADHVHRVALAHKIGELRDNKVPAVLCSKLAQGDETISLLARTAAEAEGDREIAVQEGWRLHASRKDLQELTDWSKRRDLAIDRGQVPEPRTFEDVTPRRVA